MFGIRSRVLPSVSVRNHCVIGAGCLVQADPFAASSSSNGSVALPAPPPGGVGVTDAASPEAGREADPSPATATSPAATAAQPHAPSPTASSDRPAGDCLADYTHVFGSENRRTIATGQGEGQSKALFAKHWDYLRDTLPRYHKLKMF